MMSQPLGKGSHDDLEERLPFGPLLVCLASVGIWSSILLGVHWLLSA